MHTLPLRRQDRTFPWPRSRIPENTIMIELKDGTVTIELLPDVAPQHATG